MRQDEKKYILDNINRKSIAEIAKDLRIRERKIRKFLEKQGAKPGVTSRTTSPLSFTQSKYFTAALLTILFIIALAIRWNASFSKIETEYEGLGPFADSAQYHTIAYNLYLGNGFSALGDGTMQTYFPRYKKNQTRETYVRGTRRAVDLTYDPAVTRGPAYPFFMYLVYKTVCNPEDMKSSDTWRRNWDKVRAAQCVLDSLVCIIVFFIVKAIVPVPRWPALIAAGVYSANVYSIYYTRYPLSETLTTFLVACSLLLCVFALRRQKAFGYLLTGCVLGLTSLSRTEYALFAPLFAAYALFFNRRQLKSAFKKSALVIIGAGVVIAPWLVRNYVTFKEPIFITTGMYGYILYTGTFKTHDDLVDYGKFPASLFKTKKEQEKAERAYPRLMDFFFAGRRETRDLDPYFLQLAIQRIAHNPFGCLALWINEIPTLWYQRSGLLHVRDREAGGKHFLFYFAFALYAFLSSKRDERFLMGPLWLLMGFLTLFFMPLRVEPRYSVAAMSAVISMAGIGAYNLLSMIQRKTHR